MWLAGGSAYKIVIADANDVVLQTIDGVQGVNDPTAVTVQDQWIVFTGTPTFLSATSFSVVGDQTPTLQVGRRVKTTNAGGTVTSTITVSSFAAGVTTVTLVNDSSTLDAGLSSVSYGLLSALSDSIPRNARRLIVVRVISATGTYTPTPGTSAVQVLLQGGGGAGGGTALTGAAQQACGGGGGAGGWAMSFLTTGFSGVTITIGAAGVAASGAAGGNGGTTSFGAVFNATGGNGGGAGSAISNTLTAFAQGSVGGFGGSGNILNAIGGIGGIGLYTPTGGVLSGNGGMSYFGQGGSGIAAASNGITAVTLGAGGSGSAQGASGGALTGGGGASGVAIIWEYE